MNGETGAEKALRLVAEHGVVLLDTDRALVCGDHAVDTVAATGERLVCSCAAGAWSVDGYPCAHALAAGIQLGGGGA
jgi:hypothetical protein